MKPKLFRGAKVTARVCHINGDTIGVAQARVTYAHRGRLAVRTVHGPLAWPGLRIRGQLAPRDEGRMWARGWDTPDAAVLAAEIALLTSR